MFGSLNKILPRPTTLLVRTLLMVEPMTAMTKKQQCALVNWFSSKTDEVKNQYHENLHIKKSNRVGVT